MWEPDQPRLIDADELFPQMQYRDFTLDPKRYPASKVKEFVDDLHAQKKHYGERSQ